MLLATCLHLLHPPIVLPMAPTCRQLHLESMQCRVVPLLLSALLTFTLQFTLSPLPHSQVPPCECDISLLALPPSLLVDMALSLHQPRVCSCVKDKAALVEEILSFALQAKNAPSALPITAPIRHSPWAGP